MHVESARINVALAFGAAAAVWPTALCALTDAMATPLQRALQTSWCGGVPQAVELLGHCPACWGGAAAFLLAAALTMSAPILQRHRASARSAFR